jgi:dolichyl-phosphate beta-glucosyltransferase
MKGLELLRRVERDMSESIIVIPCYNEAARLDAAAFESFARAHADVRIVFVNDGSTDDTERVLRELCPRAPGRMEMMSLEQNSGKAEAVRRGMIRAFDVAPPGAAVGFWDADLATPLDDILAFRDILERNPAILAVFGARVNLLGRSVRRKLMRHYIGRVFATAATAVLRIPIYDTQCGAKMFRSTDVVRGLFVERFVSSWIFDVEIIARLRNALAATAGPAAADVIYEHPLMVWHDVAGSKLRARHFITVGIDLLRIAMRYGRRGATR